MFFFIANPYDTHTQIHEISSCECAARHKDTRDVDATVAAILKGRCRFYKKEISLLHHCKQTAYKRRIFDCNKQTSGTVAFSKVPARLFVDYRNYASNHTLLFATTLRSSCRTNTTQQTQQSQQTHFRQVRLTFCPSCHVFFQELFSCFFRCRCLSSCHSCSN